MRRTPDEITERDKAFKTNWIISTDDDGAEHIAQLYVFHMNRPRYALVAVLTPVTRRHEPGFHAVESFLLTSGVTIARESGVTRYSAKAARAFLDRVIEQVRLSDDEAVATIFGEATA